MANALTATTPVAITSFGSKKLLKVSFTDTIEDTDYWSSGMQTDVGILSYWAVTTDASAGEEGITVSESSGTYTFYTAPATHSAVLYILTNT